MWFLAKGMNRLTVGILMGEPVTLNGEPRHRPLFGELRGNGDAWAYNWEDTCNYFYVAFDAHGGIYGYGWK